MTVLGRLWRRAPAFRACVAIAMAASALAAMFPPPLPSIGAGRQNPALDEQARYVPQPSPPPLDYTGIDLPPLRAGRSTLIPFAGRQLPLPAGSWVEVALARERGPAAAQAVLLARMQAGALTGMILVTGTPPVAPGSPGSWQAGPRQADPCAAASGTRPGGEDCWGTGGLMMAQLRGSDSRELLLKKSLDELDGLGVILPARMASAFYTRASDSGSLIVRILLAEPATASAFAAQAGPNRRLQAWMRRWVTLLHRGFDGTLKPADVTSSLARDPAALPSPS